MILEKLLIIVNSVLDGGERPILTEISMDSSLRDDLGFDSLDLAELTVGVEMEFDVDIFEKGIVNTIGEIVSIISASK